MKTVIFQGSARKNGRTAEMTEYLAARLSGDIKVIRCYDFSASPCRDCRYCMSHPTCAIKDNMVEIYQLLDECDNVVFSSPLYFFSVPGPMKIMLDRLQPYWASVVRGDKAGIPKKKGGCILVGGAPGFPEQFVPAQIMLKSVMSDLNASCEGIVKMENADNCTLDTRPELKTQLDELAKQLNAQ